MSVLYNGHYEQLSRQYQSIQLYDMKYLIF